MSTENLTGQAPKRNAQVFVSDDAPDFSHGCEPGDFWLRNGVGVSQLNLINGSPAWVERADLSDLTVANITDLTASAAELNVLDGIPAGLTATEIGYLDGVTSSIQEQLGGKAATSHTHTLADITDAGSAASEDASAFAAAVHTHTPSDITGLTASVEELNTLDGLTSSTAELNILDGVTASAAELNVLDGIPGTLTATELGYLDGVTSGVQGQIDGKAASAHAHAASDITSGVIDQARLGSGSGGAGTKVLYDDQTYKTITAGVNTANSPNANEFASFTDADTIEGRTVAELLGDISGGSALTATQLGYLAGATSAIQTQLGTKAPTDTPTFTGPIASGGGVALNASNTITADPTFTASNAGWKIMFYAGTYGMGLAGSQLVTRIVSSAYWSLYGDTKPADNAGASPDTNAVFSIKGNGDIYGSGVNRMAAKLVSAYPTSNQTGLAADTYNKILFGTERLDTESAFASSTFTAPRTGKYRVNLNLALDTDHGGNSFFTVVLYVNGSRVTTSARFGVVNDLSFAQGYHFSWSLSLTATDTVEVYEQHEDGTATVVAVETVSGNSDTGCTELQFDWMGT